MKNLPYSVLVVLVLCLTGCASATEQIDLTTPTPTTQPLHCSPDDKPLINEQLAFKGILVGTTLKDEVITLFGEAGDILKLDFFTEFWYYELKSPAQYSIEFKGRRILSIRTNEKFTPVDILRKFGCPDVLLLSPDPLVTENEDQWMYLFYLKAGVYFVYPGGRLEQNVVLNDVYYYPPDMLEDLIDQFEQPGYTRIEWEVFNSYE